MKKDNINHPSHYTSHPSGIECIDIAEHHDFCIGNAIKYLWRAGLKSEDGISKKEKQVEDIILLIEKNIGSMVDISSITKQSQQTENSNQTILEVRFSSNLNDIFNLNQKLKELNLENSIETIKVQRIQTESNKKSKVNCTITFKVV